MNRVAWALLCVAALACVPSLAVGRTSSTCVRQQQGSEAVTSVAARSGGLTLTLTTRASAPPPGSFRTSAPPRGVSQSVLVVSHHRRPFFELDTGPGEVKMALTLGKEHRQADLHIAGTQVTGEIDGRQVVFSTGDPKGIKYVDGKRPSKWKLPRATLHAMRKLSRRAQRAALTCASTASSPRPLDDPGASSECDQCHSDCSNSFNYCMAGVAGASIGCDGLFMVCGAGGGALCLDQESHCDNDCDSPSGECCPVFCTDGTLGSCCDAGSSCCGASCGSVCRSDQTCCGDGHCCDPGTTCADPGRGLCCPGGVQTCAGQCCPRNAPECRDASESPPLCCAAGAGPECGHGSMCCPSGQVCQLEECCLATDICPGADGQCCPPPHTCLGSQCCDPPSTVCLNTATHTSTCCGEFDTCIPITGICCGKLTGIPCGLFCCNGDTERCTSGQCCPKDQACGNVCCPAGQRCADASTGTCSACPAGLVACQPIEGSSTCCAAGQACCPGGPDTGGPVCCTDPAQQTCCGVPDNVCHFESFCIR